MSIIIFDISAQILSNTLPLNNDLKKSKPPKKVINPNKTTKCIKNFFLPVNLVDKYEKTNIGKPRIDGIYEVKDWLLLKKLTAKPHRIKSIPYKIDKFSIFKPNALNSMFSTLLLFIIYFK